MMRKHLHSLLLLLLLPLAATAQEKSVPAEVGAGQIVLNPFVSDNFPQSVHPLVQSKLLAIATRTGAAGAGADDRFVIAANAIPLKVEQTATIPQKTAVKLSLAIYVGDGLDGTLFSSYEVSLSGIGTSEEQAWHNAISRLQPANSDLQQAVEQGKTRITDYYNRMAPTIIAQAKAAAQQGRYDEAITMLSAIPMQSTSYQQAQALMGQYGGPAIENANREVLVQARAAWSAQPDEVGAARARRLLCDICYPSAAIMADVRKLSDEMATQLQKDREAEWMLLSQQLGYEHEEEMARIESQRQQEIVATIARAEVEKAYARRPKVVYHVHWW